MRAATLVRLEPGLRAGGWKERLILQDKKAEVSLR
jgi:hypothetical protein